VKHYLLKRQCNSALYLCLSHALYLMCSYHYISSTDCFMWYFMLSWQWLCRFIAFWCVISYSLIPYVELHCVTSQKAWLLTQECEISPTIFISTLKIKATCFSEMLVLATRLYGVMSQKTVLFKHYRLLFFRQF
jgi:hypothetical protein